MNPSYRNAIREALLTKDQDHFGVILLELLFLGESASSLAKEAESVLAELPHDVHAWWGGPCDRCPNPN